MAAFSQFSGPVSWFVYAVFIGLAVTMLIVSWLFACSLAKEEKNPGLRGKKLVLYLIASISFISIILAIVISKTAGVMV